jgi:predicted GIY-YIG superfamily endonuclease
VSRFLRDGLASWNRFWFQPRAVSTLALVRIATGAMMAYVHLVWLLRIEEFLGPNSLIDKSLSQRLHEGDYAWSYLWYFDSLTFVTVHQLVAILVSLMLCVGCLTRVVAPLAWLLSLMVCHRLTGFLFGLDQVVMMLSTYLMLAPSGARWSFDRWLAKRSPVDGAVKAWLLPADQPSSMTTLATRLLQIHLCIVYLFGGLAKLRGEMWWDGSALWFSAASYEYQSLDMTWLGRFPILAAMMTHATIFWETFYSFLVWHRRWRPIILGMAVLVHGGIALFLGMITFGFMMIVANLAFVEPEWVDRLFNFLRKRFLRSAKLAGLLMGFGAFVLVHHLAAEEPAQRKAPAVSAEVTAGLIEAFRATHEGWSLDEVLLDDERRQRLIVYVHRTHSELNEKFILEQLVRLRKSGKLVVKTTEREITDYGHAIPAAEIAVRQLYDQTQQAFDQILVDPDLRQRFDELAHAIDPESSAYVLRKAALKLRKSRQLRPELVVRVTDWDREIIEMTVKEAQASFERLPSRPGIYIFRDATGYLYIGQSNNLRERLSKHLVDSDRRSLASYLSENSKEALTLELHVFNKGSPAEATIVREAYESDLIRTRKPRLNLSP